MADDNQSEASDGLPVAARTRSARPLMKTTNRPTRNANLSQQPQRTTEALPANRLMDPNALRGRQFNSLNDLIIVALGDPPLEMTDEERQQQTRKDLLRVTREMQAALDAKKRAMLSESVKQRQAILAQTLDVLKKRHPKLNVNINLDRYNNLTLEEKAAELRSYVKDIVDQIKSLLMESGSNRKSRRTTIADTSSSSKLSIEEMQQLVCLVKKNKRMCQLIANGPDVSLNANKRQMGDDGESSSRYKRVNRTTSNDPN
ncbi:hypothetical protein BC940DRAFT_299456 [Gongronella butleri]|nr:hypothetical protein BC940DRAFT_299456 [Gongronella butleri]